MERLTISTTIEHIILENGWLDRVDRVSFLAAGEYNENHLVVAGSKKYLFRINHGSQINQADQIRYEYNVLKAVEPSGVTPRPFFAASDSPLGGVMLMEFIPGRPFDFARDLDHVPRIFAAIHCLPVSQALVIQSTPIQDIADESFQLINKFTDHPMAEQKQRLLDYHEQILRLNQDSGTLFDNEPLCMVNTEVNSGNFIIQETKGFLVDWEKAVVSCRYQDLAHFLIPTTTLWKSDFRFTPEQRTNFLRAYYRLISPDFSFEELAFKTALLEQTILLRALSWCFMAFVEYTDPKRVLKDRVTFDKIKTYLGDIECFLN
ncbi:conserved hypothetical protein (putative phosphotransferase) [Desulforapulum autotrophicum HRM2]|uniref:Aminoglycoside phosphotransferase domain-containing protein n=1 Tax=Desulforapulum autotrophicum (strain ATCC 43914 / DSM 3382 / VKM B-1955 / HRM2) TaxID=177437 RepID=C0QE43_DESAH|nr:aminoglycoside phosphotransferase family protein [Desulforapulum autotrophicum]ACN13160.1 conserved hypothetical protein (putative phosphotransferase) [Desulforapulum autotrophicum HRM2]